MVRVFFVGPRACQMSSCSPREVPARNCYGRRSTSPCPPFAVHLPPAFPFVRRLCVRNVSTHPQNESPIIKSGFLQLLINILSFKDNEEVQCHAFSTLRNLAASSEGNKIAIVKAGVLHTIKELVLGVSMDIQSEMTACVTVLTLNDDLKAKLLEMGFCEVLIPLTNSPSSEVQGNSATALGNLSYHGYSSLKRLILVRPNDISLPQIVVRLDASDVYSALDNVWAKPEGGMHQYLHKFLNNPDVIFQRIAILTIFATF